MRHSPLALSSVLFLAGVVAAGQVTLVRFDADTKEVTVKDGDTESTFRLTDKTRVVIVDRDGKPREAALEAGIKILGNEKFNGKRFEITTDKDAVTELKFRARKGK